MATQLSSLIRLPAAWRDRSAARLGSLGVRRTHLVLASLGLCLAAGVLFYFGRFRLAAAVLVVDGLVELLADAVERAAPSAGPFAAFAKSIIHRCADAAVFGGIILYYSSIGADTYVLVALAALVGALLTSYARARAGRLVEDRPVGLIDRPQRLAVLIVAGFSSHVNLGVWVLAAASALTVVQRIVHARLSSLPPDAPGAAGKAGDEPA